MRKHNAENERIKRKYFQFLKEAKQKDDASIDAVAAALARFEASTSYRSFKDFHREQAIAFKKRLAGAAGSDKALSKSTQYAILAHLKRFIEWLSREPGYTRKVQYSDAEYFNLSEKDCRIATARRETSGPTLEQVRHVIATMPAGTDIELRNRALVAFVLLTGARDNAVASMKLKHVDIARHRVLQDARDVRTKFSKTFTTVFFPVGDEVRDIVVEWVKHLREKLLWGDNDALFPRTHVEVGAGNQFAATGLERENWSNANPIRQIFRQAFEQAGLPYFNPHSLRKTLVALGMERCTTPEAFKAWSQNLGHEGVLTTFMSYGTVSENRQAELIADMSDDGQPKPSFTLDQLARFLQHSGVSITPSP
ncbi:MAG: site-specific integrase [Xanthomonadales bacterium]|nr:site-specific integrase [Xanthomonadales bacterium]